MLDHDKQMMIVDAQCHSIAMHQEVLRICEYERLLPHVLYRPKLFLDGNQWCALYGEDLQSGVAGFGNSPKKACENFDANWHCELEGGE